MKPMTARTINVTPRCTTTLAVTADHGRGATLGDGSDHRLRVPGGEQDWAAFISLGTPAKGEISGHPIRYQRYIAPAILELPAIVGHASAGAQATPVPEALA